MTKKSKEDQDKAVDIILFVIVAGFGASLLFLLVKYLFFSDVRIGRRRIIRIRPAFDGVFPIDIPHDLARIRPQLIRNDSASTILSTASL